MNTSRFKNVLFSVARRLGIDPAVNLQQNVADALAGYISDRVRHGWNEFAWPEICQTERRVFRPAWDAETSYALGQEVWDEATAAYYVSLSDGNVNHPVVLDGDAPEGDGLFLELDLDWLQESDVVSNATWWAKRSVLERVVLFDQPGQTKLGDVLEVWRDDPRLTRHPRAVAYWISETGVQLGPDAPDMVWVKFRLVAPEFTATPWKADGVYAAGEVRYFSDGECYQAAVATAAGESPVSAAAKWVLQPLPAVLASYVELGAYADALDEAGQTDKAAVNLSRADGRLTDAMERVNTQQRQTARFSVRGR